MPRKYGPLDLTLMPVVAGIISTEPCGVHEYHHASANLPMGAANSPHDDAYHIIGK